MHANFEVVNDAAAFGGALVLRDLGPWDRHRTVTNDVEHVVEEIARRGLLPSGRRLLWYDSEGELSEALVENGVFLGFRTPIEERVS